jgi:hypothetical protein
VYIYIPWWKESFIWQRLVARMLINSEAATTTTTNASSSWQLRVKVASANGL